MHPWEKEEASDAVAVPRDDVDQQVDTHDRILGAAEGSHTEDHRDTTADGGNPAAVAAEEVVVAFVVGVAVVVAAVDSAAAPAAEEDDLQSCQQDTSE